MITNPVVSGSMNGAQAAPLQASNELGKDAFLKLLTAQLANQDPLQPVDNQAFVAQLAQFSSLEQMQGVATRLDNLLLATATSTQLNAASLVGRNVTYRASSIDVTAGQPPPRITATTSSPGTVAAVIQNVSGMTVRTIALGARDAGTFDVPWDGLDDSGRPVPTGTYSIRVSARDASGQGANAGVSATGAVDQVAFGSDGAQLVIGSTHVKLSDVSAISERKSP